MLLLVYLIGYVGINLMTMGQALSILLGWPVFLAAAGVAAISAVYVTFGGQTSVIMTDLFQGFMLLATGLVLVSTVALVSTLALVPAPVPAAAPMPRLALVSVLVPVPALVSALATRHPYWRRPWNQVWAPALALTPALIPAPASQGSGTVISRGTIISETSLCNC